MTANLDLPLSGIRVLDLTHRLAGPTMSMLLGDWGADVIKIEWWYRMDAWRGMVSIEDDKSGAGEYNKKNNWLKLNRSKRSLTLNLKEEKAKEIFLELVRQSDVVCDNFSAGVMERLGLGYDVLREVNPRIIMICLPGFGSYGPHMDYVGNGGTIQGYAGLSSITGYDDDGLPRLSIGIWADPVCGINGAIGIGMALMAREQTGEGQYIELAQAETMVSMMGEAVLDYTVNGRVDTPIGNGDAAMAPHGSYRCKGEDEWITIAVANQEEWQSLCKVAGQADWLRDARFASQELRWQNLKALDNLVEAWTQGEEKWELTRRLQKAGVAATPIVTIDDFFGDRSLPAEGFYQEIDHPHLKTYPGPAVRLDGEPIPLRVPPPDLGAHNEEILGGLLGYTLEQIEELSRAQVI